MIQAKKLFVINLILLKIFSWFENKYNDESYIEMIHLLFQKTL